MEKNKCKSRAKRGRKKKEEGKKKKKKSSPQNRTQVPLMNGHNDGHVLIWADKLAYCTEFDRCPTAILHSGCLFATITLLSFI